MPISRIFLFIALSFSITSEAAQVISIADGDTMTVSQDGKPLKLRLANIDAPEKKQPWGQRSKQSLSDLCWGKDATYQAQTIDRYGRTVALVYCAGVEVNRTQVERGMAWVYVKYNKDASLVSVEAAARAARIGLWSDPDQIPPWEFRRPHKKYER